MALSFSQRLLIKSGKYLKDAFSEPGVLHVFDEDLFDFSTPKVLEKFIALTDREHGGQSSAELRHSNEDGAGAGCMVFEGRFSSAIPPDAPSEVHRLGQAACQSKARWGHYFWLGEYERQVASTIKYRLRGDGRLYSLFMKSDSYVEGVGVEEIWQAFVETKDGEWQDISIPVVDFLLTTGGYLTRDRRYINLRRVTSVGIAVAGGRDVQADGPYQLCVSRIAAGYDTDRSSGNED